MQKKKKNDDDDDETKTTKPFCNKIRRVQSDKTDGKQQKGFGMINIPVTKQYNFDIEDSVSHRHQDRV